MSVQMVFERFLVTEVNAPSLSDEAVKVPSKDVTYVDGCRGFGRRRCCVNPTM